MDKLMVKYLVKKPKTKLTLLIEDFNKAIQFEGFRHFLA